MATRHRLGLVSFCGGLPSNFIPMITAEGAGDASDERSNK